MALVFWSDPHLGLTRTSHTTPASRANLRDALYDQAIQIVDLAALDGDTSFCLGDLFDTTENDEKTILQGARVAEKCALVLAGNHDLANRDGKVSSLELIGNLAAESSIAIADSSEDYFVLEFPEAYVVSIPHKRTQQLFDETIDNLSYNMAEGRYIDKPYILLLHCNYCSHFATDDASLNLTKEQAEGLLDYLDYILIGHEHIPRADFGGRLQILGNTHPTSFSDISDKFIWTFQDGELTKKNIWSTDSHLVQGWEWLLNEVNNPGDAMHKELVFGGVQFIEIEGTAPASKLPDIARAVQKLWGMCPDAFMIRNNVKAETVEVEVRTLNKALDIPSRISADLQGTPFGTLWEHYLAIA